jgi:hypothetical protein
MWFRDFFDGPQEEKQWTSGAAFFLQLPFTFHLTGAGASFAVQLGECLTRPALREAIGEAED